jgi:Uma2 family endonuclease
LIRQYFRKKSPAKRRAFFASGSLRGPVAFSGTATMLFSDMVALAKLAPSRMTVAEFLDWPGDGSRRHFELVDGEPRAQDPASVTHGIIQATISRLLGNHLAGTRCKVVVAPGVIPRVRASMNFRIPDLAVNCMPDERGQRALPEPILIIESLSPSNEAETRENVWAYSTIPSIREILLVRSTDIGAELLRRNADGAWPEQPELLPQAGEIRLDSIDLRTPLAAFYEDTHLGGGGPL